MHSIKTVFLLLLMTSCANQRNIKVFDDYKAKPSKVESFSYFITKDDTAQSITKKRDSVFKYVQLFDKKGRKTKTFYKNKKGIYTNWIDYKYSPKGQLVKQTYFYKDSSINYILNYDYSKNGKLKHYLRESRRDTVVQNYTYHKTKDNLEIQRISKPSNSSFGIVILNEKGLEIELISYKNNDQFNFATRTEYDDFGNVTKRFSYKKKDTITSFIEFEYDTSGNETVRRLYNIIKGQEILEFEEKIVYIFDDKNNVLKETMSSSINTDLFCQEYSYTYY